MPFTVDGTVIPGLGLGSAVWVHVSVAKGQPMCTHLSLPFSTADSLLLPKGQNAHRGPKIPALERRREAKRFVTEQTSAPLLPTNTVASAALLCRLISGLSRGSSLIER